MRNERGKAWFLLGVFGLGMLGVVGGCNVGPDSVSRDRIDYGEALARSSREELLRNIVRLRYLESPVFLSINSVVNQYTVEGTFNAGATWAFGAAPGTGNALGAKTTFSDRPTITYSPLGGRRFARAYLRPVPTSSVLSLVQSGYRVDFLFPLLVDSINLHRNGFRSGRVEVPTDPEFTQIVELLASMQDRGEFHIRAESGPKGELATSRDFIVFDPNGDPGGLARLKELESLLGISEGTRQVEVRTGTETGSNGTISISTKSLLRIMSSLSVEVDVPQREVDRGTVRVRDGGPELPGSRIRIPSASERPQESYVAIEHQGYWYWIGQDDLDSKEIFLWVLMLTNLTDTDDGSDAPILTIPAG